MSTPISATELTAQLDSVLRRVEAGDEVIVEGDGQPRAVLISFAAFQDVLAMRERQRKLDVLDRLNDLRERVSARNGDLSFEQAEEIAEEITQAALQRMVERGEIQFERDLKPAR